jgi:diadenosine tetraphosphate (Ap4A) HIT family hydrolase
VASIHRSRKNEKDYEKHRKRVGPDTCEFCAYKKGDAMVLAAHKYFLVIENKFKYDLWDMHKVERHLMLVPKRHIIKLKSLKPDERTEFAGLLAAYDLEGYNIYARTSLSMQRSIPHQHTHLIKLEEGKPRKFVVYAEKPLINIAK